MSNLTSRNCILLERESKYTLFKCAINFAESGLNVWFIGPETITNIPTNIKTPEHEILELITFLYLKDYKELIAHLNEIHLWNKIPDIIILSEFESYINIHIEEYNSLISASVLTSLLDSVKVCQLKNKRDSYLLVGCCDLSTQYYSRIKVLSDLYIPKILKDCTVSEVMKVLNICP